jgi:hypothetical protein
MNPSVDHRYIFTSTSQQDGPPYLFQRDTTAMEVGRDLLIGRSKAGPDTSWG